ncbi:hypothetical protein DENSPDRAFT_761244, partial [Dentipellis sp. KUC8613]
PTSPVQSFFPTGPSAPHAFSSFQQSPRDQHQMYSSFGTAVQGQKPQSTSSNSSSNG